MNNQSGEPFRFAKRDDVPAIVAMLADDVLGANREQTDAQNLGAYLDAFDEMEAQGGNRYLLAVNDDGQILGCLQITFIPGLSRGGIKRAQIEGVRVVRTARGEGIGTELMGEAKAIAKERGCGLIQLTTDRARTEALHFYQSLGYEDSHHGLKLAL